VTGFIGHIFCVVHAESIELQPVARIRSELSGEIWTRVQLSVGDSHGKFIVEEELNASQ
jgi:hypothetical protein